MPLVKDWERLRVSTAMENLREGRRSIHIRFIKKEIISIFIEFYLLHVSIV